MGERVSTAVVIVVSTRARQGIYEDLTGPVIQQWLTDRGFETSIAIRADGEDFAQALPRVLAEEPTVILTTGGTGISATDRTPDITRALLDYEIPGIAEKIRTVGAENIATAVLSRGVAGVTGRTLVVNLPGSPGGVRDGLLVLEEILSHAVEEIWKEDTQGEEKNSQKQPGSHRAREKGGQE